MCKEKVGMCREKFQEGRENCQNGSKKYNGFANMMQVLAGLERYEEKGHLIYIF